MIRFLALFPAAFHPAILLVGNLERPHTAHFGQAGTHPTDMLIHSILPPADPRVNRKLQHDIAVLLEELAKSASPTALRFGFHRQVEEYHQPHETNLTGFHVQLRRASGRAGVLSNATLPPSIALTRLAATASVAASMVMRSSPIEMFSLRIPVM